MHSVPHSSALKKILSFDYRYYLKTRMCRCKPVGITCAKVSRLYFAYDYVYLFRTRTAKHKMTSQVSVVFHDEFVHIELNPGPVVTQGNNPNNLIELLQS